MNTKKERIIGIAFSICAACAYGICRRGDSLAPGGEVPDPAIVKAGGLLQEGKRVRVGLTNLLACVLGNLREGHLPLTRLVRRKRLVAFGKPFEIGLIVGVGGVEWDCS